MSTLDTLVSLAAIWVVACLTPGPNVLFFAATVLSASRAAILSAAAGILTGTAIWGLSGLLGLFWLFEAVPVLAIGIKIAGAAYLIYVGLRIVRQNWRAAPALAAGAAIRPRPPLSVRRAFVTGLLTNLSNPKSLVFVTSLFAVTHLAQKPLGVGLAGVGLMLAISTVYYVLCALVLTAAPAATGGRVGRYISLGVGAMMMAFGVRLGLDR